MTDHAIKMKDILGRLLFDHGMKVTDLARAIEIPQPTIHRIVTGKCAKPHQATLEPIAKYFDLTVDQLKGLEPISGDPFLSKSPFFTTDFIKIPVFSWDDVSDQSSATHCDHVLSSEGTQDLFATQMNDSSMEPLFPRDTVLIFSPEKKFFDRSYVLVSLGNSKTTIFRQLLIDGEHQFLSPLNPNSDIYKMRLLGEGDEIMGKLKEARFSYES